MESTVKQLAETKVQLTITLGAKELKDAEQVALTKLSKTTKVPGFRQGKVPASVAAKHVNQQELQEQLLDDAISKAVAESFIANKIQAIDRPAVEVKKYVPNEQLEFTAEVETMPEITLGDYKKLTAKPEKASVSAKDVDEVIERMSAGYAESEEITDRAAKDGDDVVIDFVGKKDDVPFDGGAGSDYTLSLGAGQFIPGFEEGIVGHKIGDEFDLELEFPKEYHAADLAGQKVVFSVNLKKILEKKLPKVDDEFAKKTGSFQTLDELKADIKAELTKQKEQEADNKYKDALLLELIQKSKVSAPEVMVQDHMRSIEQDFEQNLMYRGMTVDAYVQAQGFKDVNEWREKEVRPTAENRVKAGLVLSKVTEAENMTLTDTEIDEHVEVHKKQYANNPQALEQISTPEARRDIANHYLTEKTIDRLVELNK